MYTFITVLQAWFMGDKTCSQNKEPKNLMYNNNG